jgi:serine protease Do
MLKRKNAGGWVLALVAVTLFSGLILRGLSDDEPASPENQISAGMVMTGNQRASALDLSAVFEATAAQYLPAIAAIHTGSCGLLVSSDGYILTSGQNFSLGDSVRVVLNKGRRFAGSIVGADPLTNLALIKIAAKGLPYVKFGDSDRLRLGQWVMAIGSAVQATPAITAAIINAKGRSKVSLPQLGDFIHIDAPIDRANCGGALVSLDGELVGINTMSEANSGGLAIPSNLARRVMQSLMKEGKVTRGYIGTTVQDLDQNLAKALNLNSTLGAVIVEVAANSPAERVSLRRGDVILQFANVPIANANEFENAVAAQIPDKTVQAVVWRDTVKVICEVTPVARPAAMSDERTISLHEKPQNKLGLQVQNMPPDMIRRRQVSGVTVSHLDPHSSAAGVLAVGDIIQEMNRKTIRGVRDFNAALKELRAGDVALLLVRRGEKNFFSGVEVKE